MKDGGSGAAGEAPRPVRWASRLWSRGVVGTFLTGLFVLLPIAITVAVMAWAGRKVFAWLGPGSLIGEQVRRIGLTVGQREVLAHVIGWTLVVAAIWLIGLAARATARYRVRSAFDAWMHRIPVVNRVYGPVSRVVSLLRREEGADDLRSMRVVYCRLGAGRGFLGLLGSDDRFRFDGEDCVMVLFPGAPLPMTGWLLLVPAADIDPVDMDVESLLQVYVSLGVLAADVVPGELLAPGPSSKEGRGPSEQGPGPAQ